LLPNQKSLWSGCVKYILDCFALLAMTDIASKRHSHCKEIAQSLQRNSTVIAKK